MKKMIICRYNSICEESVIKGFQENGYQVEEFNHKINSVDYDTQYMEKLAKVLLGGGYEFVFTINFFPIISALCNMLKLPYLSWMVDSPMFPLYSDTVYSPYNRIFIFDLALYQQYVNRNPSCIFYLPLAGDSARWERVCTTITREEEKKFACDISFIGSLYIEKCPYDKLQLEKMPKLKGYLEAVIEAQSKVYGYNFLPEVLHEDILAQLKAALPFYEFPENYKVDENYYFADEFIGMKVSANERIEMLNLLAEQFSVELYTLSDTSKLRNVVLKGSANSSTQMPKIYRLSRINLNPTIKPIKTGLPQRIWDILSCGGFLMTNYQSELSQYFDLGVDLETYSSMEELMDKCVYYLTHEEERRQIAQNGYQKIKACHTIQMRLSQMLELAGMENNYI